MKIRIFWIQNRLNYRTYIVNTIIELACSYILINNLVNWIFNFTLLRILQLLHTEICNGMNGLFLLIQSFRIFTFIFFFNFLIKFRTSRSLDEIIIVKLIITLYWRIYLGYKLCYTQSRIFLF